MSTASWLKEAFLIDNLGIAVRLLLGYAAYLLYARREAGRFELPQGPCEAKPGSGSAWLLRFYLEDMGDSHTTPRFLASSGG